MMSGCHPIGVLEPESSGCFELMLASGPLLPGTFFRFSTVTIISVTGDDVVAGNYAAKASRQGASLLSIFFFFLADRIPDRIAVVRGVRAPTECEPNTKVFNN